MAPDVRSASIAESRRDQIAAAFPSRAPRRPADIGRTLEHSGPGERSSSGRWELVWRAPCLVSSSALESDVDPFADLPFGFVAV